MSPPISDSIAGWNENRALKLKVDYHPKPESMFATEYNIYRRRDLVGILSFDGEGFSLPNYPELLEHMRRLDIKGHEVVVRARGETAMVHVYPRNFTKNRLLRAVESRLRHTGFVLYPRT